VHGVPAPFHVALELKPVSENVSMVFLVKVVVWVIMRTPQDVILKPVQPGQTGNHGQCVRPHAVVDYNDVRDTVETEPHVLEMPPKNAFVKLMHVLDGQIGLRGQTVVAAVVVVQNASPDSA
jgi:hypothetical protein